MRFSFRPANRIPDGLDAPAGESPGELLRKDLCAMPRQRIHHRRITNVFPDDFPQRLKRFQEESGLSWSEIARRLWEPIATPYGVGLKAGCGLT